MIGRIHLPSEKTIVYILMALCLSFGTGIASEYFISPNGSDVSGDGSHQNPWRTPWYAKSQLTPPYTLYFLEGEYLLGDGPHIAIVPPSGTPEEWTVYAAYPGDNVTIRPDTTINRSYPYKYGYIHIGNVSYVEVSGFNVGYCYADTDTSVGILCYDSDHIRITNNHTVQTWGTGIYVYGPLGSQNDPCTDVVIDGNDIDKAMLYDDRGEVLSVLNGDSVVVSNNDVHDEIISKDGICIKSNSQNVWVTGNEIWGLDGNGIYVAGATSVEVSGNLIHDCDLQPAIVVSNECQDFPDCAVGAVTDNIRVWNNICYRNHGGISIKHDLWDSTATAVISNISVMNNTTCYNDSLYGIYNNTEYAPETVVIRNNIAAFNGPSNWGYCSQEPEVRGHQIGDNSQRAIMDHNLMAGGLWKDVPLADSDSTGDPVFCNYDALGSGSDLHVANSSPALGGGSSIGAPTTDFDGNSRSAPYDVGAYQGAGCATGVAGPPTATTYSITILALSNGTPLPGDFDVVVTGLRGSVRHSQKQSGYQMKQPICFSGDVYLEWPCYQSESQHVSNLSGPLTLTFTTPPFHGTLSSNATWGPGTIVLDGDVLVSSGVTLTIAPCTDVLFTTTDSAPLSGGDPDRVDLMVAGSLEVNGTSASPVSFQSIAASPQEGDWAEIYITGGTASIEHAEIRHSNYGVYASNAGAWSADSCTFESNLSADVTFIGTVASSQVANCTFDVGGGTGIQINGGSSSSSINLVGNAINGNGSSQNGVLVNDDDVAPLLDGNVIAGFSGANGRAVSLIKGNASLRHNDIRTSEDGIYIASGQPIIGWGFGLGNQISGCTRGIHAQCTGMADCPCTIDATVGYNAIVNNTYGVVTEKTIGVNLGTAQLHGNNQIYGNTTYCVSNVSSCGKLPATGNYWATSGHPCPQPDCEDPNGGTVDTKSPLCDVPSGSGCSACDPPAGAPMAPGVARLPTSPTPVATRLLSVHPNPFSPRTTIEFELKEPARATISIFDVAGRLVKTAGLGEQPAGRHSWAWTGTDQNGNPASRGVYYVVLEAGSVRDHLKAVLLK